MLESLGPIALEWAKLWLLAAISGIAIFLACRFIARFAELPARIECWLLRASFVKLLVIVAVPFAVGIPLLPGGPSTVGRQADASPPFVQATENNTSQAHLAGPRPSEVQADGSLPVGHSTVLDSPRIGAAQISESQNVRSGWLGAVAIVAFSCWLVGLSLVLARQLLHFQLARQVGRSGVAVEDEKVRALVSKLCRGLGIRRQPRLKSFDDRSGHMSCMSPCVTGIFRPVVLIPKSLLDQCSHQELQLILKHELGHIARLDLLWNLLVTLVQSLFFFHPGVWWATRRLQLCQELACDSLVLDRSPNSVCRYAKLLLKLILLERVSSTDQRQTQSLAVAGATGQAGTLQQRIMAIQARTRPSQTSAAMLITCIVSISIFLIPWKVVAVPSRPARPPHKLVAEARKRSGSTLESKADRQANDSVVRRRLSEIPGDTSPPLPGYSEFRIPTTGGTSSSQGEERERLNPQQQTPLSVSSAGGVAGGAWASASASLSAGFDSSARSHLFDMSLPRRSSEVFDEEEYSFRSQSSSLHLVQNGRGIQIEQHNGRFEVTLTKQAHGGEKSERFSFESAEEFERELPTAYRTYQQSVRGHFSEPST